MGQAKQRGSLGQRISEAKGRIDALRPSVIICNDCKGEITEIETMNIRGMAGIDAAFAGVCPHCKGVTYAIKGNPDSVEALMLALSQSSGEIPLVGVQ